ncbi:hypothetical protein [Kushneria sinocarnis]|nr:hypothetical protein [Kushneria sinocarnis]
MRWVAGLMPLKAWLGIGSVALLGAVGWWGISTITSQADTIGQQSAQLQARTQRIESLTHRLDQQRREHQREIKARDAAVTAQRQQAQEAQKRANELDERIDQARGRDGDVDACMGMQLPAAVADSLRQ